MISNGDAKGLKLKSKKDDKGKKIDAIIPLSARQSASSDLCQYLHPKRKAIELSGKDGEALYPVGLLESYLKAKLKDELDGKEA